MSRYDVVINGQPFSVEFQQVSGTQASVLVNGIGYNVQLPTGGPQPVPATPPPRTVAPVLAPVAPPPTPTQPVQTPQATSFSGNGEPVLAPMPGNIVNILARVGDTVSVGTTIMIMEAMKMENEINSTAAGTVVAIQVNKGETVKVNQPLAIVAPG